MSIFQQLAEKSERKAESRSEDFESVRKAYYSALREKALELQEDGNFDLGEADIRFSTSLNLSKVRSSLVAIIGAGGLGNWQWRILAAMGFRRIAIYDDDKVGIENVGPQAHSVFDLGLPKTVAVANSALAYRGIQIIPREKRVMSYQEICEDLGESPVIVIGCTDSMESRKEFVDSLYMGVLNAIGRPDNLKNLPELFLDYRMSLGDWVCYLVPVRALAAVSRANYWNMFINWYKGAAIFPDAEGVQEPCTERAIAYTGANVASFTGSVLHWFYSGGKAKLYDEAYLHKFVSGEVVMPARKVSFSSRDFEFITDTGRERKLIAKLGEFNKEKARQENILKSALCIPLHTSLVASGGIMDRINWHNYQGCLAALPRINKLFICGRGKPLSLPEHFARSLGIPDAEKYPERIEIATDIPKHGPFYIFAPDAAYAESRQSLRILNARPGSIFRIDPVDENNFIRVQEDYIELLEGDAEGINFTYSRHLWDDMAILNRNTTFEYSPSVTAEFDRYAAIYDNRESCDESEAQDRDLVGVADLVAGMRVNINGLIGEIISFGANHIRVIDDNGDLMCCSIRNNPEIFLVDA